MKNFKILLVIVFCAFSLCAKAQKNLVENGGFEDDTYGWNAGAAKITPWDMKSGKSSCAIIAVDATNWVGIDQQINIPKKAGKLEISAWLKAINVVKGKDDWNGAVFSVEFLDKADKKVGDGTNVVTLTGDHAWEQTVKEVPVPAGAVKLKLLLAMGYATGTFLIDDVAVKVVSADVVTKN
ncbi:hypothetical protein [Mucilaginibacter celer]|uniref:CBM-cenC domain-containing protein n=1 Tax=Mucilaginibacter celer TaxID=2305508 RepID=A0A494VRW3_9SPHI|nr:hypothetical protein [Mucilaginibacter celer]AYL94095.1 hypothetical protein HYN43_001745 [Mucilaginibacter celer]